MLPCRHLPPVRFARCGPSPNYAWSIRPSLEWMNSNRARSSAYLSFVSGGFPPPQVHPSGLSPFNLGFSAVVHFPCPSAHKLFNFSSSGFTPPRFAPFHFCCRSGRSTPSSPPCVTLGITISLCPGRGRVLMTSLFLELNFVVD